MPGRGKTTLALEFAHRHQTDFESVHWLPCVSGNLASIASELTRQLALSLTGDLNQILAELRTHLGTKRCLIILDNSETDDLSALIPGGVSSVLVTTRQPGLRFLRNHPSLRLELFIEEQCFDLFRQILGSEQVMLHESACRQIFIRVGQLPLAIALAAASIKYDAYTISDVATNLPSDVTAYISEVISKLPRGARDLLSAMSACAPEGFRLSLAAEILRTDEATSVDRLRYLLQRSLVLGIVGPLAVSGSAICFGVGRLTEAFGICSQMVHFAKGTKDKQRLQTWLLYQVRILRSWGRSDEALCLETGNRHALSSVFGSQAIIFQAKDLLEEALALFKKEETIELEHGNKLALSTGYGNQSIILRKHGRFEEALALLEKAEGLYLELGDKDGLHRVYGNQAAIFHERGRFDDSAILLRKQEALCIELGDKANLAFGYWSQGIFARSRKNPATEQAKLTAALAIFTELNMSIERDAVAAELQKSSDASWSRKA